MRYHNRSRRLAEARAHEERQCDGHAKSRLSGRRAGSNDDFTVVAMSRAPATFRQSDITRAIRAARAAGVDSVRIDITKDGKISIILSGETPKEPNEWDRD